MHKSLHRCNDTCTHTKPSILMYPYIKISLVRYLYTYLYTYTTRPHRIHTNLCFSGCGSAVRCTGVLHVPINKTNHSQREQTWNTIFVDTSLCAYACVYVYTDISISIPLYLSIYLSHYISIYLYVFYIYIYIYISIYIYIDPLVPDQCFEFFG